MTRSTGLEIRGQITGLRERIDKNKTGFFKNKTGFLSRFLAKIFKNSNKKINMDCFSWNTNRI